MINHFKKVKDKESIVKFRLVSHHWKTSKSGRLFFSWIYCK